MGCIVELFKKLQNVLFFFFFFYKDNIHSFFFNTVDRRASLQETTTGATIGVTTEAMTGDTTGTMNVMKNEITGRTGVCSTLWVVCFYKCRVLNISSIFFFTCRRRSPSPYYSRGYRSRSRSRSYSPRTLKPHVAFLSFK